LAAAAARLVHYYSYYSGRRSRRRSKRKSGFCDVFGKVNGLLLVALYFGGCRVLGCIVSCDLMVWING